MIRLSVALIACLAGTLALAATVVAQTGRGDIPRRIVVLDWALAEQVIDLGITPVGAPETALYAQWVVDPPLPETVVDIGLRTEPALDTIARLAPDVILASDLAPEDVARLERIAPVQNFAAWSGAHDNVEAARRNFLSIARLVGRETRARERIAAMEAEIADLAEDLHAAFGGSVPPVAVTRLNDAGSLWLYGDNSIPIAVLERMDIPTALAPGASKWGVAQRPLETLAQVEDGIVLAIRPHMAGAQVFESRLWQFMPFVRAGRFAEADPVWSYGGYMSLGRHARRFHAALMDIAP